MLEYIRIIAARDACAEVAKLLIAGQVDFAYRFSKDEPLGQPYHRIVIPVAELERAKVCLSSLSFQIKYQG